MPKKFLKKIAKISMGASFLLSVVGDSSYAIRFRIDEIEIGNGTIKVKAKIYEKKHKPILVDVARLPVGFNPMVYLYVNGIRNETGGTHQEHINYSRKLGMDAVGDPGQWGNWHYLHHGANNHYTLDHLLPTDFDPMGYLLINGIRDQQGGTHEEHINYSRQLGLDAVNDPVTWAKFHFWKHGTNNRYR